MEPQQPIYTARPIFQPPLADPVPIWGRVRVLDGCEDVLVLELPRQRKAKKYASGTVVAESLPDWMVDLADADAGLGVTPFEPATEISNKAWTAIRQIVEMLDGCPKNGHGRHESLNRAAYWLARLYAEGELPEDKARDAFFTAAEGINNGDGKYDAALLQRHIDDAFADIGR
jgi:hypothetical protein